MGAFEGYGNSIQHASLDTDPKGYLFTAAEPAATEIGLTNWLCGVAMGIWGGFGNGLGALVLVAAG